MSEFLDPRECPYCRAKLPRQATHCLECGKTVDQAVTNPTKAAENAEARKAARAEAKKDKPDKPGD